MAAEGMQREEQAEAVLAAMEQKLKKGPGDALGLDVFATQEDARKAFLGLTKLYHPNRFARFSQGTQRRANAVFVAIKRAHDDFTRVGRTSGNLEPERPSQVSLGRPSSGVIARPSLAKVPEPTAAPAPRAVGNAQPPTVAVAARSRRPSAVPQWLPQGASRPKTTSSPNPLQGAAVSARAPVTGATTTPPGAQSPASSALGGSGATRGAGTGQQGKAGQPVGAKAAIQKSPEELKFEEAKLAINQQRWTDADALFGELAVDQPQEKKFRVFRHYVRGRLAQDERRIADARQEYERALALDATFASARIALGQLPAGGFLGRLFKR